MTLADSLVTMKHDWKEEQSTLQLQLVVALLMMLVIDVRMPVVVCWHSLS